VFKLERPLHTGAKHGNLGGKLERHFLVTPDHFNMKKAKSITEGKCYFVIEFKNTGKGTLGRTNKISSGSYACLGI
jgi:hypothetical protein